MVAQVRLAGGSRCHRGRIGRRPVGRCAAREPVGRQWRIPKAQIPCNDRADLGIIDDQVFSAVQNGSAVTFTYTLLPSGKGGQIVGTVSPDGRTFTGGDAPNGWTENPPAYCFGAGHGRIQLLMAADARSFSTVAGESRTDLGNLIDISGTYLGGGTEPRTTPCAGGPWTGRWQRADETGPAVTTFVQSGSTVNGTYDYGGGGTLFGTVSGASLNGTWTGGGGPGPFSVTLGPDGASFSGTVTGASGLTRSLSWRLLGCPTSAPDLQGTIPSPQTLRAGPTSLVAPGRLSLRSLKRSKCVLVRVASRRPARVLVSIFSGRLSIRLFEQRLVVFRAPGHRQVCIRVPFRARTFNVRTPLKVALGYTAGAEPQREGPKPPPRIRPIRLVP